MRLRSRCSNALISALEQQAFARLLEDLSLREYGFICGYIAGGERFDGEFIQFDAMFVGVGVMSKIFIAFLVATFPIVVDTVTGLNAVPPELVDLRRSLRSSRIQEFVKIRFPMALPIIFSGLTVAVALSVVGAVVGNFVQADQGLGHLIVVATSFWKTRLAFAAMAILSVMGIVLFPLVAHRVPPGSLPRGLATRYSRAAGLRGPSRGRPGRGEGDRRLGLPCLSAGLMRGVRMATRAKGGS